MPPRVEPPGKRHLTLYEQINRLQEEEDDTMTLQLMEELEEQEIAAVGFRWHSESTQNRQDRALRNYLLFVGLFKLLPRDATEDQQMEAAFPADHKALFMMLRKYLMFIAIRAKGRAKESVRISYRTLVAYRTAMIFWARRSHSLRELPAIPPSTLFNKLTEAIRHAAAHYGLTVTGPMNRTHVGLAELRQMIDFDSINTPSIEVAEGHHLAWCIARVCSIRPGSIGPSKSSKNEKKLFLSWRDITITRGAQKGQFEATIVFRSLKTNRDDPESALAPAVAGNKQLRCKVMPPQLVENLVFSIPHRILVIALRRGYLDGIDSLDELLDGDKMNILIKQEHLDDPVVLAARPRGRQLTKEPTTADSLTAYLQLRGKKLCYKEPITMYSVRRRSGADLVRQLGPDVARLLMGHDADSRTLERYYVDVQHNTNISAATLNEPVDSRQTRTMIEEDAPLALNALSPAAIKRAHGAGLNAMVRKLIATDENYPVRGSAKDKANYKRRVAAVAFKVLLDDEVQRQRQEMTRADFNTRANALKTSKFMEGVLSKARGMLKAPINFDGIPDINDDGEFAEEVVTEEPEPELEVLLSELSEAQVLTRQTDEGNENEDPDIDEVPYDIAVRTFMEVLLTNSANEHHDYSNEPVSCVLCEEDETIDDKLKMKTYRSYIALESHKESYMHTPKARFARRIKQQHDESESPFWSCPYCEVSHPYAAQDELMRHIQRSTQRSSGAEHDRKKTEDGWYEPGWGGEVTEGKKRRASDWRDRTDRVSLARYNVRYSKDVELQEAVPHPALPSVQLGGPQDNSIPEHLSHHIHFTDLNMEISARNRAHIKFVEEPEPMSIEGLEEYIEIFHSP